MGKKTFKYEQIKARLIEDIEKGTLKEDDRIPSEVTLAQQWRVSPVTVSKALTQLEEEGYVIRRVGDGTYIQTSRPDQPSPPNRTANLIAMLAGDMTYGLIPHLIHQIERQLSRLGYHLLIKDVNHNPEEGLKTILEIDHNLVCGYIFTPLFTPLYEYDNSRLIEIMRQTGRPVLLVNSYLKTVDCPSVSSDNRLGGYQATKHLIEKGHQHIAILWQRADSSFRDRLDGYLQALDEHNILFDESYVVKCQYVMAMSDEDTPCKEALDRIMAHPKPPTAFFALDDFLAVYALQYCQDNGIAVPNEMAIIGFDDFLPTRITSIRQDIDNLAKCTVDLFLQMLQDQAPEKSRIFLPTTLIQRSTT